MLAVVAKVRKATLEDLPAILRLAHNFMASTQYAKWFKFAPEQLEPLATALVNGAGVILLAISDAGEYVGMLAGMPFQDPFHGGAWVLDEICWWVEPAHRNGLIGPRLLATFELWARQKGLRLIKMVAPVEAPEVGTFYLRSGYITLETVFYKRLDP